MHGPTNRRPGSLSRSSRKTRSLWQRWRLKTRKSQRCHGKAHTGSKCVRSKVISPAPRSGTAATPSVAMKAAFFRTTAFFVYVDYWYRHSAAAVVIYSKAGSCYLTGEQLGLKERSLQKTASHRLWLNGESKFVELQGKTVALLVPTVQGEKTITLAPTVSFNGAACVATRGSK